MLGLGLEFKTVLLRKFTVIYSLYGKKKKKLF